MKKNNINKIYNKPSAYQPVDVQEEKTINDKQPKTLYNLLKSRHNKNIKIFVTIGLLHSGSYYFNELLISQLQEFKISNYINLYDKIDPNDGVYRKQIALLKQKKLTSIKNTLYIPNASANITGMELKDIAYTSFNKENNNYISFKKNGDLYTNEPNNTNLINYGIDDLSSLKYIVINFNDELIINIKNIFNSLFVDMNIDIKYIFYFNSAQTIFYNRINKILYLFKSLRLISQPSQYNIKEIHDKYNIIQNLIDSINKNKLSSISYKFPSTEKKKFFSFKSPPDITLNALQFIKKIIYNRDDYINIIPYNNTNNDIFKQIMSIMISSTLVDIYKSNIIYYYKHREDNDYSFMFPLISPLLSQKEIININNYFINFFNSINIKYNLIKDDICYNIYDLKINGNQFTEYYTYKSINVELTAFNDYTKDLNITNMTNIPEIYNTYSPHYFNTSLKNVNNTLNNYIKNPNKNKHNTKQIPYEKFEINNSHRK